MNYIESIKLLSSSSRQQIKPGLDRISRVLQIIGNPQDRLKIIHAAGTNGKGSVCAVLANILKCSGYKTGLYTSPHLTEYTERIKINGIEISKQDFADLTGYICACADKNGIYLTEFEILTAAAFKYFADSKADFAVIETGLGGRLDGTNAAEHPILSIITSISKDHTDLLGDTIEKIAFEKAGIIKVNIPVIVSSSNKGYAEIKSQALKMRSELITADSLPDIIYENGVNYAVISGRKYEFPLLGLYQKQNLALVLEACRYLERMNYKIELKDGLKTAEHPARFQYIKKYNLIIDGAHNPDGAQELKKSLSRYFPDKKKIFIYGTINTKDYKSFAENLFSSLDEIYYCGFNHPKAVSYEEYKKNVPFLKNLHPFCMSVLQRRELKIAAGSLYMAGSFIKEHPEIFYRAFK